MAISSNVSRQSVTKAGQITNTFFTPDWASSRKRSSVLGPSHLARPSRDWKATEYLSEGMFV